MSSAWGTLSSFAQRRDVTTVFNENEDGSLYRRLVLKRGRLVGALAIGDWSELNRLQEAVKARGRLFPWQRRRFQSTGLVWPVGEPRSVKDWPRAAIVCNCTGVTRGQIGDSVALGAMTLDDVKRETGASTVCGSCKVHIGELLESPALREPVKAWAVIAALSLLALLAASLTALLPVVPTASQIEARGLSDTLFLDSFTKQVTGYTLLALSVLCCSSFAPQAHFLVVVWRLHGMAGVSHRDRRHRSHRALCAHRLPTWLQSQHVADAHFPRSRHGGRRRRSRDGLRIPRVRVRKDRSAAQVCILLDARYCVLAVPAAARRPHSHRLFLLRPA